MVKLGILALTQAAYFLNGENIQPYHPFTLDAVREVVPNQLMELNVEIFPTNVVIKEGQ